MNYVYNNELDRLFILTLINYHISTCFGRINSPSSGVECVYVADGTCYYTTKLTVCGPG
jgi:hypothetical protein